MNALNRDAPVGHAPLPTLTRADWSQSARWWRGLPRRCPVCSGRLVSEPPHFERFGRIVCAIGCGREVAWIQGAGL